MGSCRPTLAVAVIVKEGRKVARKGEGELEGKEWVHIERWRPGRREEVQSKHASTRGMHAATVGLAQGLSGHIKMPGWGR